MGKQSITSHKGHPAINRLTHAWGNGREKCRTKYQYDALGQVTSAKKYWSGGTLVAGEQFTFGFDDSGNRKTAAFGGDQYGYGLRSGNYTANNLNQYTSRDVPGYLNILGAANASAGVLVNSNAVARYGEYYRAELTVANSSSPVWFGVTNLAALGGSPDVTNEVTGNVFVPKTPEVFHYDLDGNLTNDGRFQYVWDGENRLVQVKTNTTVGPQQFLKFEYDSKGRRIRKLVWSNAAGSGGAATDLKFVYDQWNAQAELDASNSNARVRTYLWGLDLSGSLQGAGGVGGLIAETCYGSQTTNAFVAFDGNGNVMALVNGADDSTLAQYEYGPFGEPLKATGLLAKINPFGFSTKYQDAETDLIYYGYRYYSPSTGRWHIRDRIAERGGVNLFSLANNSPIASIDAIGLQGNPVCGPYGPCPPKNPGQTWYDLCFCTLRGVTLTPYKVAFTPHYPTYDAGVPVFVDIDATGNRSQCKCKQVDNGSIRIGVPPNTRVVPFDNVVKYPDAYPYFDAPGIYDQTPAAWPGTEAFELLYNLTITVTCVDSFLNQKSGSATITGDYKFTVTFNPDHTTTVKK